MTGVFIVMVLVTGLMTSPAFAVPEVNGAKVSDVTTASFSVVWMTDISGTPNVKVFRDSSMTMDISNKVTIQPMPSISPEAASAAMQKGNMKVRVSGLDSGQTYYVRAVMRDPENLVSAGYSPVLEVTTATRTVPYRYEGTDVVGFSNDMTEFAVYVRPDGADPLGGQGDLIILDVEGARYPVTAFVGEGLPAPVGVVDLNNLYGIDGKSLDVLGSERVEITVYRSGLLATLTHYRRTASDGELVEVVEPVVGFFADINLDGNVDDTDFLLFSEQYRSLPDDETYNPDYDFVTDETGVVDVREFSRFSREYGRTGVE